MNSYLNRMKKFLINPVLDKEYRLRMRSQKAMWILFSYLFATGLFATMVLVVAGNISRAGIAYSAETNQFLFIAISCYQLALITFMAPALSAGVVSGEREKQTLNLLLTTQQSSSSIILSKLFSSISFMLLIVFSSLPIYGIVFLYGGISPSQFIAVFCYYIFVMILFGAIGIMFSTLFKRTILAIILSYGVILFMYVGTLILYIVCISIYNNSFSGSSSSSMMNLLTHILAFNPGAALLSIFYPEMLYDLHNANGSKGFFYYVPLWLEHVILYSIAFVIFVTIAIRKLRPTAK